MRVFRFFTLWAKKWWRGGDEKFTVATDRSPFWYPNNDREELHHATGIKAARRIAKRWVRKHPYGQARIIPGHLTWEDEDEHANCEQSAALRDGGV